MNNFIFIVPKTPVKFLNKERKLLWNLCYKSLLNQNYSRWTAITIGGEILNNKDDRFIELNFEGRKEEKLQKATQYIIENNIIGDYIIRLDDDDIINPTVLGKASKLEFDLYVDKHQWFWHYESGKISNRVWNWFPNTCIHKREHALTQWGKYAKGDFKHFKNQALLIENDHSKLHPYYKNKNIIFSDKKHPIYIRTITSSSITAGNAINQEQYLKKFGLWHKNNLKDFQLPENQTSFSPEILPKYTLKEIAANKWLNFRCKQNYLKDL